MGIQGLLKELGPVMVDQFDARRLARGTCAIDGSAWLFKAAYACALELALGRPTNQLVNYVERRVRALHAAGLRVVVCFDGNRPNLKSQVSAERRARQAAGRAKGNELYQASLRARSAAERRALEDSARNAFAGAISVTFEHTLPVLRALRAMRVPYIVAPFEADAQLAALAAGGHCSSIVTEDSDVAVFLSACGAGCDVLYRMDDRGVGQLLRVRPGPLSEWVSLDGIEVMRAASAGRAAARSASAGPQPSAPASAQPVAASSSMGYAPSPGRAPAPSSRAPKVVTPSTYAFLRKLSALSARQFVQLCVLAGCDYLTSPPGLGLRTGVKYLQRTAAADDDARPARIVREMAKDGVPVPDGYRRLFCMAEAGFRRHVVFDPALRAARRLVPVCGGDAAADSGLLASPARPGRRRGAHGAAEAEASGRTVGALPAPLRVAPSLPSPSSEPAGGSLDASGGSSDAASTPSTVAAAPKPARRRRTPAPGGGPAAKAGTLFALVGKMKAKSAAAPPQPDSQPPHPSAASSGASSPGAPPMPSGLPVARPEVAAAPPASPAGSASSIESSDESPLPEPLESAEATGLRARGYTVQPEREHEDPLGDMVGRVPAPEEACAVARGDAHPRTMIPVVHPAGTAPYASPQDGLVAAMARQGGRLLFAPKSRSPARPTPPKAAPRLDAWSARAAGESRGRGEPPLRASRPPKDRSSSQATGNALRAAAAAAAEAQLAEDALMFASFSATSQPKAAPARSAAQAARRAPATGATAAFAMGRPAAARAPKRSASAGAGTKRARMAPDA
ncbi:hypothetical protein FNF27_04274 [Cafeteria roenbergensis]|uniref:Exonuclease 1 n=2 Tax=Cafeteria roenbergensis TaxID=33653 RepID=A0A5A8E948_CAFRO|nr:hypothetical protein FNF27_04274 [Cafeteria roenbergensis]